MWRPAPLTESHRDSTEGSVPVMSNFTARRWSASRTATPPPRSCALLLRDNTRSWRKTRYPGKTRTLSSTFGVSHDSETLRMSRLCLWSSVLNFGDLGGKPHSNGKFCHVPRHRIDVAEKRIEKRKFDLTHGCCVFSATVDNQRTHYA